MPLKLAYYNVIQREGHPNQEQGPFNTAEDASAKRQEYWRSISGIEDDSPTITEVRRPVKTDHPSKRHVFPTGEIPHLWAHQVQADARNHQDNLFFEGPTIYSYRHSWPLAHLCTRKKKGVLVLTNSDKYGPTTSRHQWIVNAACSHLDNIPVPNPLAGQYNRHKDNLVYFQEEISKLHDQATRVLSAHAVEWRKEHANTLHEQERKYRAYFGIRTKQPATPDFKPLIERARAIESPDPIRDAPRFRTKEKREKANEKRAEKFRADYLAKIAEAKTHYADNIEKWRSGADVNVLYSPPYLSFKAPSWQKNAVKEIITIRVDPPTMLRIKDQEIETSHGATIPLSHTPRLWKLIRHVMQSGTPYQRNGHTEHAGHYPIDRIEPDGTLTIGCHVITFDEIQRIANQLGLLYGRSPVNLDLFPEPTPDQI